MATSSTVAFNPSVSQCIEEAYERCNVQLTSGMSLRTALFSLNILLSEWGNRGIHFWEVTNTSLYLKESQRQYSSHLVAEKNENISLSRSILEWRMNKPFVLIDQNDMESTYFLENSNMF